MTVSYEAIIEGDHVTWVGKKPAEAGPLRVTVQVEALDPKLVPNGKRVAAAARRAKLAGGIPSIPDAAAWQREQRIDRPMPGREP